jgi:hypothetical protein
VSDVSSAPQTHWRARISRIALDRVLRNRPETWAIVLILTLAIGGATVAGTRWYAFHQSCTVGRPQDTFQVTVEGLYAPGYCRAFVKFTPSGYRVDQPDPTATVLCRYTIRGWADTRYIMRDGLKVTVRDKYPKGEGNLLCAAVFRW